ncbi:RNA polymerase sigma factor [Brevibacterium antiquum]|uniref:RNA polymerase sigma factor n=1 Tax=Brevibacterium antiquum TaxID=234835 RepID=UPI0018DFABBE|nr:sigma-70 family RNA polymerase sigma factor [Brevibacterium antiquum]
MDVHAHQPGEELADFTESELLSLIEAGTAGAYSEIYRRYRDDAVARASTSLPDAKARQVTDDAFLSVLRSLLNRSSDTAEGLRPMVDAEIDAQLANLTTSASGSDAEAPEAALVSQALSNLPDNWQRILWLREVERLSPEAVAEQLNIKASTVDRLAGRARQGLQDEWQQVRPTDSKATADHRTALIPALLTSPIVIERLSATLAQANPEPAPAVAETAGTGTDVTETAVLETSAAESPGAETAAAADGPATEPTPAPTVAEGSDAEAESADDQGADAAAAAPPSLGLAAGAGASAGAGAGAGATLEPEAADESTSLTVFGAPSAAAQTSAQTPAPAGFSMPKPVLIPVVAACIGLLGTLVGMAVVPQQVEQTGFQSGNAGTAVSPADSSSKKDSSPKKDDKNTNSQSPDDTNSDKHDQEAGSENSKTSDPDRDEDEKSSQTPGHDDSRSDDSPSTEDNPGDKGDSSDRPSAEEPDEPSPSDSDKPDPESPSEPTPPPSDDPETPSDPPPSDEPTEEPSDEPSEEPSDEPSDEPTDESPEEPSSPGSENPTP